MIDPKKVGNLRIMIDVEEKEIGLLSDFDAAASMAASEGMRRIDRRGGNGFGRAHLEMQSFDLGFFAAGPGLWHRVDRLDAAGRPRAGSGEA